MEVVDEKVWRRHWWRCEYCHAVFNENDATVEAQFNGHIITFHDDCFKAFEVTQKLKGGENAKV